MEKLLTTKEVAEMFGVDSRTVLYNFIPKGLRYFVIGNRNYRFDFKDIEKFKEEQKAKREHLEFVDTRTDYKRKMNKQLKVV